MKELAIKKIRVRDRFRKDLGDIDSLAASIDEVGLLHPIVVRPDGRLIAGERRLAACKELGWTSVPVTFVDLKEVIRGEFAENAPIVRTFCLSKLTRSAEPYCPSKRRQRKNAKGNTAVRLLAVTNSPGNFPGVMAG